MLCQRLSQPVRHALGWTAGLLCLGFPLVTAAQTVTGEVRVGEVMVGRPTVAINNIAEELEEIRRINTVSNRATSVNDVLDVQSIRVVNISAVPMEEMTALQAGIKNKEMELTTLRNVIGSIPTRDSLNNNRMLTVASYLNQLGVGLVDVVGAELNNSGDLVVFYDQQDDILRSMQSPTIEMQPTLPQ